MSMDGLYPIIRRARKPLVAFVAPVKFPVAIIGAVVKAGTGRQVTAGVAGAPPGLGGVVGVPVSVGPAAPLVAPLGPLPGLVDHSLFDPSNEPSVSKFGRVRPSVSKPVS